MHYFKSVILTAFTVCIAFTAVLYSSCSKKEVAINNFDPKCQSVVCYNGGTCSGGICACPDGYEGANCQNERSLKFVGSWTALFESLNGNDEFIKNITIRSTLSPTIILIYNFPPFDGGIQFSLTDAHSFSLTAPISVTSTGSNPRTYTLSEGSGTIDALGIQISGRLKYSVTENNGSPETEEYTFSFF